MVVVRQVTRPEPSLVASLCELLVDAVHGDASVGFLAPLSTETARGYWEDVLGSLGDILALWVAEAESRLVGCVQLAPSPRDNQRHRADLQKLLVLTSWRGRGVASQLMSAAESAARAAHRTLLVLDTEAGSTAEAVYVHLGWQRVGEIPDYARTPHGRLRPTAVYFKRLDPL